MIHAWRLVRRAHGGREDAFSGEGARLFGGRWNSPGVAVVYSSDSLALAALETLTHADKHRFERSYAAFRIHLPEGEMQVLEDSELPTDWRERPVSLSARRLGDTWVRERVSVALSVPSVIVPLERNFLINPAHLGFSRIEIEGPLEFSFDARLEPGKSG